MRCEDVASQALAAAKAAGAEAAEAFVLRVRSLSAYVDDSRVKSVEEKADLGLAMRVIKEGRVGQSSSSVSSLAEAGDCALRAARASSLLPPDKVFKGFALPERSRHGATNRDRTLESRGTEELAELMGQLVGAACEPRRVKVPNGVLRAASLESVVANTEGVQARREGSLVCLMATAMTQGRPPGEGSETFFSPYLKDLDPEGLGASLRAKAKAASQAKAYKGNEALPVILPPHELAEMLGSSIEFALSAENVNRKRSPLAGRIGQPVAASCLTLQDDPADPRGMLCSPHDDEGVPTRRKELLTGGVLKGFLYDLYNSHLSSVPSTGNGLRRDPAEAMGNYQLNVAIDPVCLVVSPGGRGVAAMVAEMDRGLVVEKISAPDVNPITGDFGLEVRCGHIVEGGEAVATVKHCLLSGNMFRALGQIGEVANDATVSRNLILPSMRFESMELIGSQ